MTPVTSGVPQGSVLGPSLFLLYINDVCDFLSELNIRFKLFADDLKIYSNYDLRSGIQDLSAAINNFHSWCEIWQLSIAKNKCSVCHIGSNNAQKLYTVDNYPIEKVDTIRDLGVHVDSKLKFDKHIAFTVRKAFARAKLILKCFISKDRSL